MKRSPYYNLRLPQRGARENESNDPADIEDLTYDFEVLDTALYAAQTQITTLDKDKADKTTLAAHAAAATLAHPDASVTDAKIGTRRILDVVDTLQNLLTLIGQTLQKITGTDAWYTVTSNLPNKAEKTDVLEKTNTTAYAPTAAYHPATKAYVDQSIQDSGAGDMLRSVYDTDRNGIVDNAAALGGNPASYFAPADGGTY